MNRKPWVISGVIASAIVSCVLLLPLPKRISVMMPAVGKNDGGYLTSTSISWEGWYLDYWIRNDRIKAEFILNAGTKKEVILPVEGEHRWTQHENAETTGVVLWQREYDGADFPWVSIHFNKAFDAVAVNDEKLGVFVAPATNEAEAKEVIERFRRSGLLFEW